MKGLRKFIPPFAPDQSGACSVLYSLGGIIVICDAGGCTGNVCGFDEPRWFKSKSAIFSAGLRDMDAILGRDDRLVEKLSSAAKKIDAAFAAIIGTPVPAVIGTDYAALRRMAEKKIGLPVLTIDTNGMQLYDVGAEKAYMALFKAFAGEKMPVREDTVGVIGAIPLDMPHLSDIDETVRTIESRGWKNVMCYGINAGLEQVKNAACAAKNIVVSPCGIKSAQYLYEKFGTPYELDFPIADRVLADLGGAAQFRDKKVLIMHQQIAANAVKRKILDSCSADITVATWFMHRKNIAQGNDLMLSQEDELAELVARENYDIIIGDETMERAAQGFKGKFLDFAHFAVSGKM
jgi:hypothetical protein